MRAKLVGVVAAAAAAVVVYVLGWGVVVGCDSALAGGESVPAGLAAATFTGSQLLALNVRLTLWLEACPLYI